MSIDDDAVQVLSQLAQYGKGPDDDDRGHHSLEGEELSRLTKLGANRLNDAVAMLEGAGLAETKSWMGTHPYDFGEVFLTTSGRREAQTTGRRT